MIKCIFNVVKCNGGCHVFSRLKRYRSGCNNKRTKKKNKLIPVELSTFYYRVTPKLIIKGLLFTTTCINVYGQPVNTQNKPLYRCN